MPSKSFEPIFLHDVPACVYSDSLVIADAHIGLETEILGKGSAPVFLKKNVEQIVALANENNCKKIILLGDVKHKITAEDDFVFDFFKGLQDFEVTIVPGNHDGSLKKYAMFHTNVKFAEQPGMIYNNAAFAHGHTWPTEEMMQQDYLFVGHSHPAIEFVDKLESKSVQKIWLMGGLEGESEMLAKKYPNANLKIKVIFVPAFNPLITGSAINSTREGSSAPGAARFVPRGQMRPFFGSPKNRAAKRCGDRSGGRSRWSATASRHRRRSAHSGGAAANDFYRAGPLLKNKLFKAAEAKIYLLNGINLGSAKNYLKTN
ncbi:Calcineurin-like phosphoesterase [Candidatus Gugararchaeum adminiculabundum]|nr:Calcineurin-like phosphoesterase [Candidatus Gugararchaeum adminiculabundum]